MPGQTLKEQAHRLVDGLPETATWEDLMDRIYTRQAAQAGLRDSEEGRTTPIAVVRARFDLPE